MKKIFILLVMISISSCAKTQQKKFDVSHLAGKWIAPEGRDFTEYLFPRYIKAKRFYPEYEKHKEYYYDEIIFTVNNKYKKDLIFISDESNNDIVIIYDKDDTEKIEDDFLTICLLKNKIQINNTVIEEIRKERFSISNFSSTENCTERSWYQRP